MSKGKIVLLLSSSTHIFIDSFSIGVAVLVAQIFGKEEKYFDVGIVLACFTFATALGEPFWGKISDITRRRGVIVSLGLFMASLFFSLFSLYNFFSEAFLLPILSFISFLTGLFAGTYHSVATSLLNETVYKGKRGFYQGINNAGGSLGRMAAPFVISFFIAKISFVSAFFPYLFIGIPLGIISFFLYPKKDNFLINFTDLKKRNYSINRFIIILIIISFLRTAFFLTVLNFLPTFLIGFKKFNALKTGYIMTLILASGIVAQPIGGKLSDFTNRSLLMAFLLFWGGFAFILFIFLPFTLGLLSLSLSFFAVLMTFPILFAIIGDEIKKENMGFFTGLISGAGGFSAAIFQLISGIISERLSPILALFILSLFLILSGFAALSLKGKRS